MSVTIETIAPCRRRLRVEVDPGRVAGVRAEILQEFRKHASLPGFRPGKAPEPMVERRYAAEIDEELRTRLIPDTYREVIAEQKLRVVGYPEVTEVRYRPGQALGYTATVDVAPDFALPEYKGIPVKKKETPVTEEDVQQTLDSLRDQQAEFVNVEGRALKTGDFAVLNYTGVAEGRPIAELAPEEPTLGEHKDFWLWITSDSFLPGFCDQLLGAQVGEKRQVLISFAADFPHKTLAGKKATYFVDIVAIKEKKLPEPNDDFARKLGADSLDALKDQIRKGLAAEREAEAKADMRRQVIDHLLSRVDFDLPDSLLARETRSIIYDLVRENTLRGVSKEALEEKKGEIFDAASHSAKDRLRASFILDAIAERENITVTEAEVEARLASLAQRYRVAPERLKAQLTERGGLEDIEEQLRTAKTLDFLLANAKVEPTKE
jgi:trigger factor